MFSWLEGLVSSIASSIGGVFEGIGDTIVNAIWDNLMKWLFNSLYDAIADVFTQMGGMGAEIFDLSWIEAAVHLFFLFGWVLFGVGVIVAAFDLAVGAGAGAGPVVVGHRLQHLRHVQSRQIHVFPFPDADLKGRQGELHPGRRVRQRTDLTGSIRNDHP